MNNVKAKSTFERWIGAISTGPLKGMFSAPSTLGRKSNFATPEMSTAAT
jgi:hypothetical protein